MAATGRGAHARRVASRPFVRQVVPPADLNKGGDRRAVRWSHHFFFFLPPLFRTRVPRTRDDEARRADTGDGGRWHRGRREMERRRVVPARPRDEPQIAGRTRTRVPGYRYADRRVTARRAPEIPRPWRARPAVRIASDLTTIRTLSRSILSPPILIPPSLFLLPSRRECLFRDQRFFNDREVRAALPHWDR